MELPPKMGEFDGMQAHHFNKAVLKKPTRGVLPDSAGQQARRWWKARAHTGDGLGKTRGVNPEVAAPRTRVRDAGKSPERHTRAVCVYVWTQQCRKRASKGTCRALTTPAISAPNPSGGDFSCNLNPSISTILCDSHNSPAGCRCRHSRFNGKDSK